MKDVDWRALVELFGVVPTMIPFRTKHNWSSSVYFAIDRNGFVKIGTSRRNPRNRIRDVNSFRNLETLSKKAGTNIGPFRLAGILEFAEARHESAIHCAIGEPERVVGEVFRGPRTSMMWKELKLPPFGSLSDDKPGGRNVCGGCGNEIVNHVPGCPRDRRKRIPNATSGQVAAE